MSLSFTNSSAFTTAFIIILNLTVLKGNMLFRVNSKFSNSFTLLLNRFIIKIHSNILLEVMANANSLHREVKHCRVQYIICVKNIHFVFLLLTYRLNSVLLILSLSIYFVCIKIKKKIYLLTSVKQTYIKFYYR